MSTFHPLLAHTIEDTGTIKYPCIVSPKLDGIRCIIINGVAMSRSLKPIRNEYVQKCIGNREYDGLDGELIVGNMFDAACYRNTSSGVMSKDGEPDFIFHIFDRVDMDAGFEQRLDSLPYNKPFMKIVPHLIALNEDHLLRLESEFLAKGAEGVMVRSFEGRYKQGRSTMKEGILGKLKRFTDAEYEVVAFQERLRNENEATVNALGHTERSSHKENKVGRGDLGALVCRTADGLEFNVGTGFDDELRRWIWSNREDFRGKLVKVKSFLIGVKDAPRFPVFLGFRDPIDMST